MADEEGGYVQRLANLIGSVPAPRTMAATLTVDQVRALAASMARKMVANGVTMDLAPDMDLALANGTSPAHSDGRRSFSADPAVTTRYGLAFAQGMMDGGVVAVIKHFPGEGHDSANTDFAAALTPPLASLAADLAPFEAAISAGMPAIMVGNATVPGLSTGPASLSPAVITGLLRQRLGFQGLILTDSLTAGAISVEGLDVGAAAAKAIAAGADMVVVGSGNPNTVAQTIVDRIVADTGSGALTTARLNDAAAKVLKAKRVTLCQITP
jgi:beta-N-acetylhexosaminidase